MHPLRYFILMLTILTAGSCKQTKKNDISKLNPTTTVTGKLIPINFSDTNYIEVGVYAKDTTTDDGWSIQYLVKDDSTRYIDLYITCSKGNVKAIHRAKGVLEMRRYFIPEFEAETKTNIYFTHGCATDCAALLVFDKDTSAQFSDYEAIVEYDIPLGQVLYVSDRTYQNEENIYELVLVEIKRRKIHKLAFDGICDGAYKPACVDTVMFSKNKVSVTVSLRKSIEDMEATRQIKAVSL